MPKTLATSNTIEGIGQCIAAFYFGSPKELRPVGEGAREWDVVNPDGKLIETVRVVTRRGRFVFDTREKVG